MSQNTKKYLLEKLEELKQGRYQTVVLGNEGLQEHLISTPDDMKRYAEIVRREVDYIIEKNKSKENIIIFLTILLFISCLGLVFGSYILFKNTAISASGSVLGISILWPIKQLMLIRDSNMDLQKFVLILPYLPPEGAFEKVKEILYGSKKR